MAADDADKYERLVARQEAAAATLQQAAQALADARALALSREGGGGTSWAQLVVGCALTGLVAGVGAFVVNWGLMREHMATITERVDGHTDKLRDHERHLERIDDALKGRGR